MTRRFIDDNFYEQPKRTAEEIEEIINGLRYLFDKLIKRLEKLGNEKEKRIRRKKKTFT